MINLVRTLYRITAWLFFASVVLQVFLAGLAIFAPATSGWANHIGFGYVIGYLLLPLIVFAFVGRMPRAIKIRMGALVLLYIVQLTLVYLRGSLPIVSALHPVNAMLLFWFSLSHARQLESISQATMAS